MTITNKPFDYEPDMTRLIPLFPLTELDLFLQRYRLLLEHSLKSLHMLFSFEELEALLLLTDYTLSPNESFNLHATLVAEYGAIDEIDRESCIYKLAYKIYDLQPIQRIALVDCFERIDKYLREWEYGKTGVIELAAREGLVLNDE